MSQASTVRMAQVWFYDNENPHLTLVSASITVEKLSRISEIARRQLIDNEQRKLREYRLDRLITGNPRTPPSAPPQLAVEVDDSVIYESRNGISLPSLGIVCGWILALDLRDPRPLTLSHAKTDAFPDLVELYATAFRMHLDRRYRGDELHDDVMWYVRAAPLRADEFAMIFERLGFDAGVCHAAVGDVVHRRVKASFRGERRWACPEDEGIVAWAKRIGVWEEMNRVEGQVRGRFWVWMEE